MSAPLCKSLYPWLRSNLGKRCLAPLTSCDAYALAAAVHLAELWGCTRSHDVEQAFGLVVNQMQPHTRYLAFHAIAHCLDWGHRSELWIEAGLFLKGENLGQCSFEPGGPRVDLAKGGGK